MDTETKRWAGVLLSQNLGNVVNRTAVVLADRAPLRHVISALQATSFARIIETVLMATGVQFVVLTDTKEVNPL